MDLLQCISSMTNAHKVLNEAKKKCAEDCNVYYQAFCKTVKIGDDDPPTLKAVEALAKATAAGNLDKYTDNLKDASKAYLQATGDIGPLFKAQGGGE